MTEQVGPTSPQSTRSTDRPALIDIRGLSKHFGGLPAVDGFDLRVQVGEMVALVGPNGAGKSTVLNVLAGLHRPTACATQLYSGVDMSRWSVERRRHAGLAYTSQTPRIFASMTVYDDVATGAIFGSRREGPDAQARCEEVIAALDLSALASLRVAQLNLADRRRVELARALVSAPTVLLLDEPVVGLDDTAASRLLGRIAEHQARDGGAVLWVEHNLRAVRDHASRVVVMDHGRVVADGRPQDALADPQVIAAYIGQPGVGPAAATLPVVHQTPAVASPVRKSLLTLTKVTTARTRTAGIRDVDLAVERGDVVALLGPNGAGKTSLLAAIAGLEDLADGTIRLDGDDLTRAPTYVRARQGVVYVPAERRLFPTMTVADHLTLGAATRRSHQLPAGGRLGADDIFAIFPRLAERTRQHAGTLSGGEQQMLAIARALLANPKVLLLDEPSAGLAPVLLDELYQALGQLRARSPIAMIVAEQFLSHVAQLATATYLIDQGRVREATAVDRSQIADVYLASVKVAPPRTEP